MGRAAHRFAADGRGVSSTEYLSLAAFGALAVMGAFAAFGDGAAGGLFAAGTAPGPGVEAERPGGGRGDPQVGGRADALRGAEPGSGDRGAEPFRPADGWMAAATLAPPMGADGTAAGEGAAVREEAATGGPAGEGAAVRAEAATGEGPAGEGPAVREEAATGEGPAGEGPAVREEAATGEGPARELGPLPPRPGDREAAATVLAAYAAAAGFEDADAIDDEHLERLLDDGAGPPELQAAAVIELAHREGEDQCSGWFSTCRLKQVAGGIGKFGLGLVTGVTHGVYYAGTFILKTGEYGARLTFESTLGVPFGYTPTLDKIGDGVASFVADPKGSLETGRELAKAVGGHFVDLGKSCTTEFSAFDCGAAVGEIGFDVGLTLATGGAGAAAKGVAKVGSVASRHGASRTATALRHAESGMRRADALGRGIRRAPLYLSGFRRYRPVPGERGVAHVLINPARSPADKQLHRWGKNHVKPDGDEFVVMTHGMPLAVESPVWIPRSGVPGTQQLWSHRELARWMKSRGHQPGQPVRLFSCSTGAGGLDCLAQDLANATGSRVTAPSGDIAVTSGLPRTDMYQVRGGRWVDFDPGARHAPKHMRFQLNKLDEGPPIADVPVRELLEYSKSGRTPDGRPFTATGRDLMPRPQPGPRGPLP